MTAQTRPAALRDLINENTEGALFALLYMCKTNAWTSHLWAQSASEGAPRGKTRVLFFARDPTGKVRYFDCALIPDETGDIAQEIKVLEL